MNTHWIDVPGDHIETEQLGGDGPPQPTACPGTSAGLSLVIPKDQEMDDYEGLGHGKSFRSEQVHPLGRP